MELNIEQIIKALECCGRSGITPSDVLCDKCPYHNNCSFGRNLLIDALALIKKLTEENERLENRVTNIVVPYEKLEEVKNELMDRIRCGEAVLIDPERDAFIRQDTVKLMQSMIKGRCIEGGIYPAFVGAVVDRVAQELLEGKK